MQLCSSSFCFQFLCRLAFLPNHISKTVTCLKLDCVQAVWRGNKNHPCANCPQGVAQEKLFYALFGCIIGGAEINSTLS